MQNSFKQIFIDSLYKNSINIDNSEEKISRFCQLYEILIEENQKFNITSICSPQGVAVRHFCDCIKLESFIQENSTVLDIGCGGGFPSLPIAIMRPDLKITALDSTAKKIEYVKSTADKLNLKNVSTICGRAEEYFEIGREKFDICVSRAVARMNILSELCIPYLKIGGTFLAMKSVSGSEELNESMQAIKKLGGIYKSSTQFVLYEGSETYTREICEIKKESVTPLKYPRKYSAIKKSPL